MADFRADHEIVTNFLFDTCHLRQCFNYDSLFALRNCASIATLHVDVDNDETGIIPLTTGSVAEFYIQPMLLCVGDRDIMFHRSDKLAIPAGTARTHSYQTSLTAVSGCMKLSTASFQATCT